uniref:Uncharacterized protein n=1 Tax=Rhizophora mucronata TaxID=61149 RepID=A0A2P2NWY4_RHIMU
MNCENYPLKLFHLISMSHIK